MNNDEFMRIALREAQKAYGLREIPIGAVITKGNEIISTAYNRRETGKNALYHAETEAIYKACEKLGGWRLWECSLYVTLEPCPMCAGAIVNARIPKVYFGAYDTKNGACSSNLNVFNMENNFRPEYTGGVLEEECSDIIKKFFKELRNGR
ncbi:MAG: nucleoside deaminase [Ruminococcus sp.]|nr:nucleoside deaminase [Ruminococcus sp.]